MINKKVIVVLSTYNGQEYIVDQIASLQSQSFSNWILLVRDDGSVDDTPILIRRLASTDCRIRIIDPDGVNLGVVASFSRLLECALEYDAEYFFLCDQDDVWGASKLELFISKFKLIEDRLIRPTPLLIHSDLTVVNEALNEISPSFMKYQKICNVEHKSLQVLLSQNYVTGCASAINRSLLELAVPLQSAVMHDWWLALLASASGEIGYINTSTIAYRQHGKNTVGAKRVKLWRVLFEIHSPNTIRIWKEKQRRLADTFRQARELAERLKHKNVDNNEAILMAEAYAELLEQSGLERFWHAIRLGIRKIGFFRNLFFGIQLLLLNTAPYENKQHRE